jgi:hypothetical protein
VCLALLLWKAGGHSMVAEVLLESLFVGSEGSGLTVVAL